MDERILSFIKELKKHLAGVPEQEVGEAVAYYEEYLNDASEAGKDLDGLLQQLGSPEKIAAAIRMDTSIAKAQRNPGLKNFAGAIKYAFHGVRTPFAFLLIFLFSVLSYSLVITFFAGAAGFLAGAAGAAFLTIYEAATIPSKYALEMAGTIGMGLFCAGVLMLVALGFYRLGRAFIVLSAIVIRKLRAKPTVRAGEGLVQEKPRKKGSNRTVLFLSILTSAGLILLFVSGLPLTYFTIFNSMKPENITLHTMEYSPDNINKISVVTAHSLVRLKRGTSDKITVTYEQPDWLDDESSANGSMLSFYEKSNGRLALFRLIRIHESRTEVVVSLPENYFPDVVTLESTGGWISIDGIACNIHAKTYTGAIELNRKAAGDNCNLKASTELGLIEVDGAPSGQKSTRGIEYYNSVNSPKTIELESSRGNISIR